MYGIISLVFMIINPYTKSYSIMARNMNHRLNHIAAFDAFASARQSPPTYISIPTNYILEKVVIIHRHGDRAQISKTLGENYPESEENTRIWMSKMPDEKQLKAMYQVARREKNDFLSELSSPPDMKKYLYSGWDKDNTPYGSLTSLGVEQLVDLGQSLGSRYGRILGYDNKNHPMTNPARDMMLRSTDSCRTMQSLRAFLVGCFQSTGYHHNNDTISSHISNPDDNTNLPFIRSKAKEVETLFPQADGPCDAITIRRGVLMNQHPVHTCMTSYHSFEQRIKHILGIADHMHIPWFTVKEVITCQLVHDVPTPPGITIEDDEQFTKIASWLWGTLFHDKILNRLAIGRFIHELLDDIESTSSSSSTYVDANGDIASTSAVDDDDHHHPRILVYSGHDSTLVPLMCALDVYDGTWPPYASYFALEIVRSSDTGQRYVRSIYNDHEQHLFKEYIWCPYDIFIDRLRLSSITSEAYQRECNNPDTSDISKQKMLTEDEIKESRKEMEEEIQATLGDASSKSP